MASVRPADAQAWSFAALVHVRHIARAQDRHTAWRVGCRAPRCRAPCSVCKCDAGGFPRHQGFRPASIVNFCVHPVGDECGPES
eukprot:1588501-Prorocentrum_lima.AAC.1